MIPRLPADHRPSQPLPPGLEPPATALEFVAIRAQGPGGQNVNKVSNAVQLRYDIAGGSLPEAVKARLLASGDARISRDGVIVIKAQVHRSLPRNQDEALERLRTLIAAAAQVPRTRHATRPTRASQRRRVQAKQQRGATKALRGKVGAEG